MIDEQTRFLVAGHLSGSRTTEEALAVFEKSLKVAKKKPISIYCDGLPAYVDAYNKLFRTMKTGRQTRTNQKCRHYEQCSQSE